MRALGGRIDDAYATFEKGPRDPEARRLLEATQATLQVQIECLRTEADASITRLWELQSATRTGVERAAIEARPLLQILERLGTLPLPDTNNPVRHLLQLRALLQEAVKILEPTQDATSPATPTQPGAGGLLSARQVASELGLSDKTVYRLANEGRIPYVRIQSSLRFRRGHLDEWIEANAFLLKARRTWRSSA